MSRIRLPTRPYDLKVLKVAIEDLNSIAGKLVHEKFYALVEQLKADQNLLEALRKDFYGERNDDERYTHLFGARHLAIFRDQRPPKDIWRFKIWDLENRGLGFRFFYAYLETSRFFVILGVAERTSETYELNNSLIQRIASDFDRLQAKYG